LIQIYYQISLNLEHSVYLQAERNFIIIYFISYFMEIKIKLLFLDFELFIKTESNNLYIWSFLYSLINNLLYALVNNLSRSIKSRYSIVIWACRQWLRDWIMLNWWRPRYIINSRKNRVSVTWFNNVSSSKISCLNRCRKEVMNFTFIISNLIASLDLWITICSKF
jgi:hypothetical protein